MKARTTTEVTVFNEFVTPHPTGARPLAGDRARRGPFIPVTMRLSSCNVSVTRGV